MPSFLSLLSTVHLIGLALAVGSATVKVVLLLKCGRDRALLPVYIRVSKILTRQIIVGIALLVVSGIGWLLAGYPLSALLVAKIVLLAGVLVIGPIIDNVVEPKFRKLVPAAGEAASPQFTQVQKQYVALEITATLLFYAIIVMWVQR